MINVSSKYKKMMNNPIRERAYASIGIGIVNQDAQEDANVSGLFCYYSNGDVFDTNQVKIDYAALDEKYFKTDGSMYFAPENNELMQLKNNGIIIKEYLGSLRIDFSKTYALKGLTIDFGVAYPTGFTIETNNGTFNYINDKQLFSTEDVFGDINYLIITPVSMIGGVQRLRIKSILMGVGLSYLNSQIKNISLSDYTSAISEELPSEELNVVFFDEEGKFDVDDESSFIDFLETMQKISLSFGVMLEDGNVEWNQVATMYLKNWKSQKGQVTLSATDRLAQMQDEYVLGNRIYERTAYEEAESIFRDAGLEPDEYYIDEYLKNVILNNPMPKGKHKSCLQLLANACRCIIRQNRYGIIQVKPNFENVLNPEDLVIETNGETSWSNSENIVVGSENVYAEFAHNFIKTDGSMYFLPEDKNYIETSYASKQFADNDGLFSSYIILTEYDEETEELDVKSKYLSYDEATEEMDIDSAYILYDEETEEMDILTVKDEFADNPKIELRMPILCSYYNLFIKFSGNPPEKMLIQTYNGDDLLDSVEFENLKIENYLEHEFLNFNKIIIEFIKGKPQNRVIVNQFSFGDLTDYYLTRNLMIKNPVGYKEKRVKSVRVKIYSFANNENGEPEEVKDDVYYEKSIGEVGETKTLKNPLISSEIHADLLGEWLGNYYSNNISYDVEYRGEPRIEASDIIFMESEKIKNLQVDITKRTIKFNGAFSGSLQLRRALNMTKQSS